MADLAQACPDLQNVHRAIALTSGLGAEDHLFVTVTEFFCVAEQGAFCLHWTAHRLSYGTPPEIRSCTESGESFLINLPRAVLATVDLVIPKLVALRLSASGNALAHRLAGRGRGPPEEF